MYLLAYLAQAITTAPGLGAVASHTGLRTAVVSGAAVLAVLTASAAAAAVHSSPEGSVPERTDAFETPLAPEAEPAQPAA